MQVTAEWIYITEAAKWIMEMNIYDMNIYALQAQMVIRTYLEQNLVIK